MYGLFIYEVKSGYFTNLKEVFDVLGDLAYEYNWLLSDYECTCHPSDKIPFGNEYVWLSGDELVSIVNKFEISFIWGVVTAYAKDILMNEVLQYPLPLAEKLDDVKNLDITTQNPLSDIEIVPFDSSFLFVIAKSEELIKKFSREYPQSTDLAAHNHRLRGVTRGRFPYHTHE